jgi:hypothetical protein
MKPLTAKQVIGFWMDCMDSMSVRPAMNYIPENTENREFDAKGTRVVCQLRVEDELPKSRLQSNTIEKAIRKAYSGTHDHNDVDLCNDFEDSLQVSLNKDPLLPVYKWASEMAVTPPEEYSLTQIAEMLGYASRSGAKQFMDDHGQFTPGVGKEFGRWWLQPGSLEKLKSLKKSAESGEQSAA